MIRVKLGLAATLIVGLAAGASAAPILVAGPSPVAPFGGTVINFDGLVEGTRIDNDIRRSWRRRSPSPMAARRRSTTRR